jgi:PAS domain S-box-containing protein
MASLLKAVPHYTGNRRRKFELPGNEAAIIVYTSVLVVMGTLLIIFPNKLDSIWPLLMVPVLVAAVYYQRRTFRFMLAIYTTISALVIALSSQDKLASLVVTLFFMLAVGTAAEVLYRLSAARERARQALRTSELRFRSLSATAPIGILEINASGMCTYANARCEAIMGLAPGASLNEGWLSVIHPEDRDSVLKSWTATAPEDAESFHELRIITPRGDLRWVNASSTALLSPAGTVTGRVGTLDDITERKHTAEALQAANDQLEARVEERTFELTRVIAELKQEIAERKQAEEALHESREYLRSVMDSANILMFSFDTGGTITLLQGRVLASLGLEPDQSVGQSIHDRYRDRPDILACCLRALAGQSFDIVTESRGLTFQSYYSPIRDQNGNVTGAMSVSTDITERVRTEEALRDSEARFKAAVDGSLDGFTILRSVRDDAGKIIDFMHVDVNARAEKMTTIPRELMIGKTIREVFLYGPDNQFLMKCIEAAETGKGWYEEVPVNLPGAPGAWLHYQVIPIAGGLAITAREITERKAAENRLQEYANSQTLLLNQLMTAQEAERRRLSMDIHDGPLQSLGVSLMALDRAIRRRERGEHELVDEELKYLRETLTTTISEVRAVLSDLSLELLGNYGLEAALTSHIERFSEITGTVVNLHYHAGKHLPPEVELLMYRLTQESLANVRKHAYAECVDISLKIEGDNLQMVIADDGRGFDVEAASHHHEDGEKLGLRSMRQRVQAIRGDLTITSAPGKGTTLEFRCPITLQHPTNKRRIREKIAV